MHFEIERKFLVRDGRFKALSVQSYRIRQGYIAHDGGNTVRVRIRDRQGFLTVKGPSRDGISRYEWEREIPLADAGFWAVRAVAPEDMPAVVAMDPEVAKQNIFSAVIRALSVAW